MTKTPWPIITLIILAIAWGASRSVKVVAGCLFTLLAIGYFDLWDDTMRTIPMTFVSTVLSLVIGIPIGLMMTRSDRVQAATHLILHAKHSLTTATRRRRNKGARTCINRGWGYKNKT